MIRSGVKKRWLSPWSIFFIILSVVFLIWSTGVFRGTLLVTGGADGNAKTWEVMTFDINGPDEGERHGVFTDYAVQIMFMDENGITVTVPAYYAADGNAAETSAKVGNIWRAHFVPPRSGRWTYRVDFREGDNVAIGETEGRRIKAYDGIRGTFIVDAAVLNPDALNFARRGMLTDVGMRYLQFSGTQDYFLKTGAGSPENLLAYVGFDGTYDVGGTEFPALGEDQFHSFTPHLNDAQDSDPTWQDGKGAAILGIANYYADVGVNAQYIVTMNVEGDGQDVFPWASHDDPYVYDVSKLAQWERVLSHYNMRGVMIDMLLTETENESWFEAFDAVSVGDDFAPSRKLYYREMVARFGHLHGLVWNLGEENGAVGNSGQDPYRQPTSAVQRRDFARYIRSLDPYNHAIQHHNWPDVEPATFGPLLGEPSFSGISLQAHNHYARKIIDWTQKSKAAGRGWMVTVDEPLGWEFGARPDAEVQDRKSEIEGVLWPSLMSGSMGVDWYFGWQNNAPTSDLSNEDQRTRDSLWKDSAKVRAFFEAHIDLPSIVSTLSGDELTLTMRAKNKVGEDITLTLIRTQPDIPQGEGHIPWEYTLASLTLNYRGVDYTVDPMNPIFPNP